MDDYLKVGENKVLVRFADLEKVYLEFGDYFFASDHFCKMIKHVADNLEVKKYPLFYYTKEEFEEVHLKQEQDLQKFGESIPRINDKLFCEYFFEIFHENEGQISEEDELDLYQRVNRIFVEVADNHQSISIGKYENIKSYDFARCAFLTALGGCTGWGGLQGKKPQFAEDAYNAIKDAKNPLFLSLLRMLNSY